MAQVETQAAAVAAAAARAARPPREYPATALGLAAARRDVACLGMLVRAGASVALDGAERAAMPAHLVVPDPAPLATRALAHNRAARPSTAPNRRLPGDQRPEIDRSRAAAVARAAATELAATLLRNAGTVSDPQMAEVAVVVEPPGAREGAPAEPTANADVLRKLPQVWLLTMSCQFAEDLAAPADGLSKDGHRPRPRTAGAARAVPVRWIAGVGVKMHLLSLAYPRYPKYLHPTRPTQVGDATGGWRPGSLWLTVQAAAKVHRKGQVRWTRVALGRRVLLRGKTDIEMCAVAG